MYISQFRETIVYDSIFVYENQDSIVYNSSKFKNSYTYFQIPINFLKLKQIGKFDLFYGAGLNLGIKKQVNAYVLDSKRAKYINLNRESRTVIALANIELEISRHITKALSAFTMVHYQIGLSNLVKGNMDFIQLPLGFGMGFGLKTNF